MIRAPLSAVGRPPPSAAISAEFVITDADFRRIANMLHADAGIHVPPGKAALVYSRLTKRLRALGMKSFRDYCELVASHAGISERQQMLAALTTNVTRFFREPHHFAHLRRYVLSPLVEQAKRGGRVRVWSAACSNGAEPYSIGLTVLSVLPEAPNYDIKILATDIDPNMVAEAEAGIYSDSLMERCRPISGCAGSPRRGVARARHGPRATRCVRSSPSVSSISSAIGRCEASSRRSSAGRS
jgi:chemotaxis protein methyltransferase CheR